MNSHDETSQEQERNIWNIALSWLFFIPALSVLLGRKILEKIQSAGSGAKALLGSKTGSKPKALPDVSSENQRKLTELRESIHVSYINMPDKTVNAGEIFFTFSGDGRPNVLYQITDVNKTIIDLAKEDPYLSLATRDSIAAEVQKAQDAIRKSDGDVITRLKDGTPLPLLFTFPAIDEDGQTYMACAGDGIDCQSAKEIFEAYQEISAALFEEHESLGVCSIGDLVGSLSASAQKTLLANPPEVKSLSGNFNRVDLREANISGVDLREANFSGADLSWINPRNSL